MQTATAVNVRFFQQMRDTKLRVCTVGNYRHMCAIGSNIELANDLF